VEYSNFLVTGGAGFIGSHLVDLLVKNDAEKTVVLDNFFLGKMENLSWASKNGNVVIYKEDARYLTAVQNIIEREKIEVVFDLAVKPLPYSFVDPEGAYMTSVEIAHNLAQALRKKMFEKLIHFSSSEVYGTAIYTPIKETHPLNPTTPYGAGKAAADLLLTSYHNLFDIDISIIRPFNCYGPRQNIGLYAAVIPLTIQRILRGEKPVIDGDGKQTRDFTYVTDVVAAALKMLECDDAKGKILNVGYGKDIEIQTLVYTICRELDHQTSNIIYGPQRPGDVRRLIADCSQARLLLDYAPKIGLDEGLRMTIEWSKTNTSGI